MNTIKKEDLFMDCIVETHTNSFRQQCLLYEQQSRRHTTNVDDEDVPVACIETLHLPIRGAQSHEHHLLDPLGLMSYELYGTRGRGGNECCMNNFEILSDEGSERQEHEDDTLDLLKQQQRELFLLEMSVDKCMQYDDWQKYNLLDLPADTILSVFSYLHMSEVLQLSLVCKVFKQLYKHDLLWEKFVSEKSAYVYTHALQIATSIDDEELESLFRSNKVQKHHTGRGNISRFQEWKQRRHHKADSKKSNKTTAATTKSQSEKRRKSNHLQLRNCIYYTALRKRVLMIKKKKEERALVKKEEERRKHYERVLRAPQKWCERFYICLFTPVFFLICFAGTLCISLFLDNFIPNTAFVRQRNLALILLPSLLAVVPLYICASIAATAAEYLRMLRWNAQFDSTFPSIYFGTAWLPLLISLYALKQFVLPDYIPWRAVIAPQWVLSLMYIIVTIVMHMKFSFMKFEVDQKVVYTLMTVINLCVTLTTAFLTAKLDNTLSSNLQYSSFVFSPIWLLLFASLIAIPVGAYAFQQEEGPKLMLMVYLPLATLFLFPLMAFFIVLALQLDGVVHTYFVAVLSPLYAWQFIWFLISIGFAGFFVKFCS